MTIRKRLRILFDSRWLVLVNMLLAGAAVVANHYFQFFCRPVLWASIVLVVSFIPVVFFNLVPTKLSRFMALISFLFGIAACTCVYCILFIWEWNFLALPIALGIPVAILAYVPHFFLLQIILRVRSKTSVFRRRSFYAAVSVALAFTVAMTVLFKINIRTVSHALRCDPEAASAIRPSFMTERMLGMNWKYHLSFCAYDGWRPPLHDPALVVGLWLNVAIEPILRSAGYEIPCEHDPWPGFISRDQRQRHGLEKAITVYKRVFPDRPIQQDCSCAAEENGSYFNDPLFR